MSKKILILLISAMMLVLVLSPATVSAEPAEEPVQAEQTTPVPQTDPSSNSEPASSPGSSEPDKLVVKLGKEWAGTEFILELDYGKYPGTIVVDENGVLSCELGGSKTYTFSCLTTAIKVTPATETDDAAENDPPATNDAVPETDDSTVPEDTGRIPTMHLVLFIGGMVLSVSILVGMRIARNRRYTREADDDYDGDDK